MTREERKLKLPLLIGSLPFLMAGLDGLDQGTHGLALVNLLMAVANLIAVRYVEAAPAKTSAVIHLCNAVVALAVGYDYLQQGKTGLPYAWAVAAACFLCAAVFAYRKAATTEPA